MHSPSSASSEKLFAPRLRDALTARGQTGKALAQAVGVSENTVSNWLAGHHLPNHAHAVAVARHLQVDLDSLIGGGPGATGIDPLVRDLAALGLDEQLRALAAATPDLLRVLEEARRRAGP
jgi:transcriptional regulator with XRE-family HTH domain